MSNAAAAELRRVCAIDPQSGDWRSCQELEFYLGEVARHCRAIEALR